MDPALILKAFNELISAGKLEVDVKLSLAWIFLTRKGFKSEDFGPLPMRTEKVGKWIFESDAESIVDQAKRLMPLIHEGRVLAAKFTNLDRPVLKKKPKIYVYCVDRDAGVRESLEGLGWKVRWKYDWQTWAERKKPS